MTIWQSITSVVILFTLAACTHGGPVGSQTVTCTDYPTDSPIASTCE